MLSSTFIMGQAERMDLDVFDVLDVSTDIKVILQKGQPRAEITMVKGDRADLIIENRRGDLIIKFKSSWGYTKSNNRKAEIKLYTNELRGVEVSASAKVIVDDVFQSDKFYVEASSSGLVDMAVSTQRLTVQVSSSGTANIDVNGNSENMQIEVSSSGSARIDGRTRNLNVEISSAGVVNIDGSTENLDVEVSSAGVFKGSDMRAANVTVEASSGGVAKVWSEDSITAEANSGGVVKYTGNPKHKKLDAGKYSGGSIKKI